MYYWENNTTYSETPLMYDYVEVITTDNLFILTMDDNLLVDQQWLPLVFY